MKKTIENLVRIFLVCCVLVHLVGCQRIHIFTPPELSASLAQFEHTAEFNPRQAIHELLLQTRLTVEEGNLELVRAVLLTQDFHTAFFRAAQKSGLDRKIAEVQLSGYYLTVTGVMLPKMMNEEVASLLNKYYYGEDSRKDILFSELTVKHLISQALVGPRNPSAVCENLNGMIVEMIEDSVSDGVPIKTARISVRKDSSVFLWFAAFKLHEVSGNRRWIPMAISPSGYRD